MAERVTSADVARLAGVSQSAVSRVFTPGGSASAKTAQRVRAAAEQLGYRPNVLARSMATGRTRMIGLVVAHIDNQFYPVALEALSRKLQSHGYHVLMFMAEGEQDTAETVVQELIDYQVDGIITASVAMSDALTTRCMAAGIPVVMFNRGQEDTRIAQVTSDNYAGAALATRTLIETGHRRIAHISGWMGAQTAADRVRGFTDTMAAAGLVPAAVLDAGFTREAAWDATRQVMANHAPDAIFVGGDHMAFGVMDCLRSELGLSIPKDISIIGFDDVPLAAWPVYDLTTIRQPIDALVETTVEMLLSRLSNPDAPPRKVKLAAELVSRGTVAPREALA